MSGKTKAARQQPGGGNEMAGAGGAYHRSHSTGKSPTRQGPPGSASNSKYDPQAEKW